MAEPIVTPYGGDCGCAKTDRGCRAGELRGVDARGAAARVLAKSG